MADLGDDILNKYGMGAQSKPTNDPGDAILTKYGMGAQPAPTQSQKNDAFLSGIADAPSKMSMGLLPGGAALRAGFQKYLLPADPNEDVNRKLKAQGFTIDEPNYNDYESNKRGFQDKIDQQKQRSPDDYAAGNVLEGGLIAAPLALKNTELLKAGAQGLMKTPMAQGLIEPIKKYAIPAAAYYYGKRKVKQD